jgi:hypothetical protein
MNVIDIQNHFVYGTKIPQKLCPQTVLNVNEWPQTFAHDYKYFFQKCHSFGFFRKNAFIA